MVKKALLLLSATVCLFNVSKAQKSHCFTDEVNNKAKLEHPEIAVAEARLKAEYAAQLKAAIEKNMAGLNLNQFAKTTSDPVLGDTVFDIPIVFHVVHDYGLQEYVTDNDIYNAVVEINQIYNRQNPDTTDIIDTYAGNIPGTAIRYKAKTNIHFHLANRDPEGNPTHGITRRRSYLSNSASDQAKYDIWPPQSYINIWIVRRFNASHDGAAAYAYKPPTADVLPFYDGVISFMQQPLNYDNTIAHELGHVLNLDHPWGGTNQPEVDCGDDEVDDTPPTMGHNPSSCANLAALYDAKCTFDTTKLGKIDMDFSSDIASSQNGEGIRLKTTVNQVYIDSLSFYPTDSGASYQIVLKHNNTVLDSYSGITANNKNTVLFGKDYFGSASAVADNQTGLGVKFLTYDSIFIKSVKFYSSNPGQPYQIVLKHSGTTVASYSGTTASNGIDTAWLNFAIPSIDSTTGYSLEFAQNPGARRDTFNNYQGYTKEYANFIKITSDTLNGRYNYFYYWNIQLFNYKQVAPVNFFVENMDTSVTGNYKIEFANNPGAKRHRATNFIYSNEVSDVMKFTADTSAAGLYNYFYDWNVRYGYYKRYSPALAGALFHDTTKTYIDYPDTTNAQNVMDYTYCSKMFSYLQGIRMRQTLYADVANRDLLTKNINLARTGVVDTLTGNELPRIDLAPIADFAINNEISNRAMVCQGQNVIFFNRSWNDTVSSLNWTFSNGASTPTATQSSSINYNTSVTNQFADTGWVSVSLTANSNAGTNTVTKPHALYVADGTAVPGAGYYQEFNQGGDLGMFPIFNYYGNDMKWEVINGTGFYDNTCIKYNGFDKRIGSQSYYGTPVGDFDDFFTRAFDLSSFGTTGNCNLSFMSAGAFITANPSEMNDALEISYSRDCGLTWVVIDSIKKQKLGNNGTLTYDFTPSYQGQWKAQSLNIPAAARTGKVFFRFRYYPNTAGLGYYSGTGNNFYLDRISFNSFPTGVNPVELENKNFALAPNPTTGSTTVVTKNISGPADIIVTDVTGKVVYHTSTTLNGGVSSVDIPASPIAVKGVYLVQLISGNNKQTEKLVVY